MKDQGVQDQILLTSRTQKSKRRDLFQTAPISRNMFLASNLKQYYDQQQQNKSQNMKQINKLQQSCQKKQNITKQNETNLIKYKIQNPIVKNIGQNINIIEDIQDLEQNQIKSIKDKDVNKNIEKQNGFIFQASSSSEENDNQFNDVNTHGIIFQDKDDSQDSKQVQRNHCVQKQNVKKQSIPQKQQLPKKKIIQLFGQKIEVDIPNEDQKQQQNNQNEGIIIKKQILRATTYLPENTFVKMNLIRNKSHPNGPVFILCLQANQRFILACKKQSSQSYLLSQNLDIFQQFGKYSLGKIKTSFFGNQLNFFTRGPNPQKAKQLKTFPRQLICTAITHSQQIMSQVKPRQFTVYVLKPGLSYYKDLTGVTDQQIQLDKLYHDYLTNQQKILVFQNRKSRWNQKQKMHSLNMKGRAKIPSIKNFILQYPEQNGREVFLLGKMTQNQFSFDVHHPLNSLICMAIAMTSFTQSSW